MSNLEKAGRLLRLMGWVILVILILVIISMLMPIIYGDGDFNSTPIIWFMVALIIPIVYLYVGTAIKQNKKWAKITGVVFAIFSLINAPIGTILGIAMLYYLKKGWHEVVQVD
ncbi:hypothetical protein ACR30L_06785 [Psychromonas sp. PT13]|uniref:hypothetical protein n=1 Tax=Psychromonas sp. PT13 TaxID=3439547 RepID=UPI003EBFBC24